MRRISDRYTFGELILPFLIGTLAVLMMLVGNTLFGLLNRFLSERWPVGMVARLLLLNVPTVLVLTLPVATALAASLAVNRMARDNEITVMRGAGMPLGRAFAPILVFGALVSLADLYVADRVVPWAWKEQQDLTSVLYNLPKDPVAAGQTIRVDDFVITFNTAQKLNDQRIRLNRVVVVENKNRYAGQDDGQYGQVYTAATAEYERGYWYMKDVVRHQYDASGMTYFDSRIPEMTLRLTIDFNSVYRPPSGSESDKISFADLTRQASEARRQGRWKDAREYEVNRWFKLSLPMMCLVFALCAPPLALRFSRAGAFTGVLLSIVVVFVAWNTLLFMKAAGLGGWVPPLFAAWSTNVLFTVLGVWMLRSQE
jgi:lipopolysaccharide export system permease protein